MNIAVPLIKTLLPNHAIPLPILNGPFRGARINLNPQYSLRKVFGIYEHELNGWLESVLPRVNLILDVGANDGYFTFGCAAAFRRLGKPGEIVAFEPLKKHIEELQSSLEKQPQDQIKVSLHNCLVGADVKFGITTLDVIAQQRDTSNAQDSALIKIDVEGAELEVIQGASLWLNSKNYFLIEVHNESFLEILTQKFSAKGIKLKQVNQQPLPFINRETRSELNWWLVSEIF
jgi:hypothetical protein